MDDDAQCQGEVTHIRFWPGQDPDFVCDDHADDTRAIATALDHPITLIPVVAAGAEGEKECACTKGRMQRIQI